MKNTFGSALTVTIFGESHGPAIGAVLDGLSPGIPVDRAQIEEKLALRRPQDETATARREKDEFTIESGVFKGMTTGTPLVILIPNRETRSGDYGALSGWARPSHADYPAFLKYHGFEDARGGGHFSGRDGGAGGRGRDPFGRAPGAGRAYRHTSLPLRRDLRPAFCGRPRGGF